MRERGIECGWIGSAQDFGDGAVATDDERRGKNGDSIFILQRSIRIGHDRQGEIVGPQIIGGRLGGFAAVDGDDTQATRGHGRVVGDGAQMR